MKLNVLKILPIESKICIYCKQVLEDSDFDFKSHKECRNVMKPAFEYYDQFIVKEDSKLLCQLEQEVKMILFEFQQLSRSNILDEKRESNLSSEFWIFDKFNHCDQGSAYLDSSYFYSNKKRVTGIIIHLDFLFASFSKTPVTKFPEIIFNFKHLIEFTIDINGMLVFPDSTKSLKHLHRFGINSGNVSKFPSNLDKSPNLTFIHVRLKDVANFKNYQQQQEFVKQFEIIGQIQNLRKLWLAPLPYLPDSICNLDKLEELSVNVEKLPNDIGKLKQLKTIHINPAFLTELPKLTEFFIKTEFLGIPFTKLKELPDSLGDLSNLEFLKISNCALTALPKSFGNLQKLKTFEIYNNECNIILPDTFGNLKNLEDLGLIGIIGEVSFPPSFANLNIKRLKFISGEIEDQETLDISKVTDKCPSIFSKLKYLEDLTIDHNMTLPEKLSKKVRISREY